MEKLRIRGFDVSVREVTEIESGVVDYVVLFHLPNGPYRMGITINSLPEEGKEGRSWRSSDGDKGTVELTQEGYAATINNSDIVVIQCSSIAAIAHAILEYK